MKLSEKQQDFSVAIAKLILFASKNGIGVTMGDAYAGGKYGHRTRSNHYIRLAVDLNIFVGGEYVSSGEHLVWELLHEYWRHLGGSDTIQGDENHFSFKHNGRR